ncbi:hypothetical protein X777_08243 [Ooceraea biroi]|uniref:Uncharacterized protein n=1 Tax=Ooceraea biroi TaxID=2015173 RepID=A0A026WZ58_OOCBI|nr:hypothetical protein X777_08243 [Ooceraea biroi]
MISLPIYGFAADYFRLCLYLIADYDYAIAFFSERSYLSLQTPNRRKGVINSRRLTDLECDRAYGIKLNTKLYNFKVILVDKKDN